MTEGAECSVEGPTLPRVRARLLERLGREEDVSVLQLLEAVLTVPEWPFDEELALEVVLAVAGYVAEARERYEHQPPEPS